MEYINDMIEFVKNINYRDIIELTKYVIDISIVSYVVYKLIMVLRQTRAGQLIKGILILLIATQLTGWLGFNTINFILRNTMTLGLIAILIVFQPELRGALERIGRSRFGSFFSLDEESYIERIEKTIDDIILAVDDLSKSKTGALILIEKETKLGEIEKTGTFLNANISSELIKSIFFPYSPLHDGGIVICDGKVKAAGCILPLTDSRRISRELGTRHRAAIGISEISDAVVVVVSEETGKISIAFEGKLTRNFSVETLKTALTKTLLPEIETKQNVKNIIWKGRGIWKRAE